MSEADKGFLVPRLDHERYLDQVKRICVENSIDLLVPLHDHDVVKISEIRDVLEDSGTSVLTPDSGMARTCLDKLRTHDLLVESGIQTAVTATASADNAELMLNLFKKVVVKPRLGSASMGISICSHSDALQTAIENSRNVVREANLGEGNDDDILIQEFLEGPEFGMDVANDLVGGYRGHSVRKKLRMRAGETDKAEIVDPTQFENIARHLSEIVEHRGNLDVDVYLTPEGPRVLELNPRFGGGYPFSHEAGFNLAPSLVEWKSGITDHELGTSRVGGTYGKCDRLVELDKSNGQ